MSRSASARPSIPPAKVVQNLGVPALRLEHNVAMRIHGLPSSSSKPSNELLGIIRQIRAPGKKAVPIRPPRHIAVELPSRGVDGELLALVAFGPRAQVIQSALRNVELLWLAGYWCEQMGLRESATSPKVLLVCLARELCRATHDIPVAGVLEFSVQRGLQREELDASPVIL